VSAQGRFVPLILANCSAALLAFATQALPAAEGVSAPAAGTAEPLLRSIDRRIFVAAAGQEPAGLEALVGSDLRVIDRDGARVDRIGFLAAMAGPGHEGRLLHDEVRVRLFGSVALLHGVIESLDGDPPPQRLRYTHVFHWQADRWLLVAAQSTPLREGVARSVRQASAPAHGLVWQGSDPEGDDTDVLRQLNEQYVRAFREADVAWYDAHLAPDYVVTQGDGTFDYRAGALAAFARPTFATHFRSFPVEQVNIRRFGELALIEAENPFEMKDGRTGIARYTDIWQKQQGRWRCISAHITPVRSG
jgi:ketosteroid isomerase-like protein